MIDAMILDVDGTLCDVSSVLHHVLLNHPKNSGKKDWFAFHSESIHCGTHPFAIDIYDYGRTRGYVPLVVTARMEEWRGVTTSWLAANEIHHEELFMRGQGDFRPAEVIKREILSGIRGRGYRPVLAVEDSPDVAAMWRDEGIPTIQVPTWNGRY